MLNLLILTFIIILFFSLALSIKLLKGSAGDKDSNNCSSCGINSSCYNKRCIKSD